MSAMYLKLTSDWQENFMLYASSAIIGCTCLGGITVYSIFEHGNSLLQMIQLFVVVVLCTGVLASILTVQKPKIVLNTVIASILICTLIAILNLSF